MLAERLNTGRNSVREALRVLENEGIIGSKNRTGRICDAKHSVRFYLFQTYESELFGVIGNQDSLGTRSHKKRYKRITPEQYEQLEKLLVTLENAAKMIFTVRKMIQNFIKS